MPFTQRRMGMSQVHMALPDSNSPLWRIGLYDCENAARLKVGARTAARKTKQQLDSIVARAGFDVIRSTFDIYSDYSEHGYTHKISIGQSSIVFHTYPEWGTVTINIETCGDYAYCRRAMRKLVRLSKLYFSTRKTVVLEAPSLPLVYP